MKFTSPAAIALISIGYLLTFAEGSASAQPATITTPKQFLGFEIGEDYCLANYRQLTGYWQRLAGESDRIKLVELGKTAEGPATDGRDRQLAREPSPARPLPPNRQEVGDSRRGRSG